MRTKKWDLRVKQILASYANIFARFGFDQREPVSSTPTIEKSMLESVRYGRLVLCLM